VLLQEAQRSINAVLLQENDEVFFALVGPYAAQLCKAGLSGVLYLQHTIDCWCPVLKTWPALFFHRTQHGSAKLGQVGGFDLDVLVTRKPALKEELLTMRDHLLSADEEEEAVKVGFQGAI